MSLPGFTIVIPCYNEEGGILDTISSMGEVLPDHTSYELIVVNDGSSDGSGELLAQAEEETPNLRVVNHPKNRGYGASLKTGVRTASTNTIVITDADMTYPNERIPELLETARSTGCEMVVGSRTSGKVHIPLIRRPAKWFITRLASYLSGQDIPDLNSGLRVFQRGALEEFIGILPDGFSFTTTITLALLTNARRVEYVPIDYRQRTGSSKIRPIRDTLMFIQLIIRMVLYFNPMRVFLPVSLLLFLASLGSLVYRVIHGSGLASFSVILFVGGIQVLTTGMIADLIDRRLILANRMNGKTTQEQHDA